MKKFLHRPQRNSSSTASPLAISLLQYGHLISGKSLLFIASKALRPADNPPILPFVSLRDDRQADTLQAAAFRLWGRGPVWSLPGRWGACGAPPPLYHYSSPRVGAASTALRRCFALVWR